jgi:hypothetical protein
VQKSRRGCIRLLLLVGLGGLCLSIGAYGWRYYRGGFVPRPVPLFSTAPPYTPWPTPRVAQTFDFPLLPAEAYGPYVQGITGPLAVDTRYGVPNPALGDRSNCFRDAGGGSVPFSQLYHAGMDLWALDETGQVIWGEARNAPVHAVADGVVAFTLDAGAEGHIVVVEHLLADGGTVYSAYWHVDHVQVQPGQPVTCGQAIAAIYDQGFNSHLHWEMRLFRDGSALFPEETAGARGRCNGHIAGVGYTWDDDPDHAHPDSYGYLAPEIFVESYRP